MGILITFVIYRDIAGFVCVDQLVLHGKSFEDEFENDCYCLRQH